MPIASFSSATSAYKENSGNSEELPSSSSFRATSFSHEHDCGDLTINGNEMHSLRKWFNSSYFICISG